MSMKRKDSGKRIDNGRSAMKGLPFQNKGTYVFSLSKSTAGWKFRLALKF